MYGAEALTGSQYQMMNNGSGSLLDLNDSSNSQGNPDLMFPNNMKKKPIRDPYAHRRVEKTRRDRMNFSLNRLCSLIPETFRNQVNQGNTRVDKIKIVDIAILYVEHLHELIGQYTNTDETKKPSHETEQNKKDAQTSTCDLIPTSMTNDIDLNYIKGFFNGTLEYLSYLIEHNVISQISKSGQVVQNDEKSIVLGIELYVNLLRKFHAIYFNKIKLSPDDIKSVIESNVASEETDEKSVKRPLAFPLDNKKLIKKILHILSMYSDHKQTNVIKYYKKIYEFILDGNICNEKLNLTNNQAGEPSQNSSMFSESSRSSRSCSISTESDESDDSDQSDKESCRKKPKPAEVETSLPMTSSKIVEPKQQTFMKQTAKKLKSNLIERFSSTNPDTEENVVLSKDKLNMDASGEEKEEMISIFILHSSHDFYLSGCLDKSLLDSNLLNNVIKNPEFRPRSVQKIKLDVVFGADIVIKKDNRIPTFSQYASLFSNKRKMRESGSFLVHPTMRKFKYNLSEENRILESYLRAIRKAHENNKKQFNGSKYDNLTVMYKNYSRSGHIDNEDQMSEKTFYTV